MVIAVVAAGAAAWTYLRQDPGPPNETTVRRRFANDDDLKAWRITGGEWLVRDGAAVGRQVGDDSAYLTWPVYYGAISSVTIRGGIASPANLNFRVAVGHVSAIFNWELNDVDVFRNGLEQGHDVRPRGLTPGVDHEIRFVQDGRLVRILVDGVERWESPGHMRGTVTVYPAIGSTIRVKDVEIHGVPVPWIEVDGPSQRAP